MKKADMQAPGVKGFVEAFKLHILIMWNLLAVAAVPEMPSPDVVSWFNATFASMDDVHKAREGSSRIPVTSIETAGLACETRATAGTHAANAARVDKSALAWIAVYLSRFGFTSWAPDFKSTPYSLYNSAYRIIAIFSFQQALLAHAYIHFVPVMSLINDFDFLIKIFDWYVWDIWWKRWDMERMNPGCTLRKWYRKLCYQWCARLCDGRVKTATSLGLHRYAAVLKDAKCHSDEEFDTSTNKYIVHAKAGRSKRMTALLQKLDEVRINDAMRLGKALPRTRHRVANPAPAWLPTLPKKTSLDWYDINFFNSLSVSVRRAIAKPAIALHDEDSHVTVAPAHPVEKLTMKDFMTKYGEVIMSQYDVPDSDAENDDNTYWMNNGQDSMHVDTETNEEMAEAVDAALTVQQELFRLTIAL